MSPRHEVEMARWQRRTLAILSLGGGAVGAVVAVQHLVGQDAVLGWLLTGAFVVLYATGAWWGLRLLERADDAMPWLLWFWILQIPAIATPIAGYSMASGFHLTFFVVVPGLDVGWSFRLGSQFAYSLLQMRQPWQFGLNVFALGVAWWIWRKVVESEAREAAATPGRGPVGAADQPLGPTNI